MPWIFIHFWLNLIIILWSHQLCVWATAHINVLCAVRTTYKSGQNKLAIDTSTNRMRYDNKVKMNNENRNMNGVKKKELNSLFILATKTCLFVYKIDTHNGIINCLLVRYMFCWQRWNTLDTIDLMKCK